MLLFKGKSMIFGFGGFWGLDWVFFSLAFDIIGEGSWELHLGSPWTHESRVVLPWFSVCSRLSWFLKTVLILFGFLYIFRLPFSRDKFRSFGHCCSDKQMCLVDLLCVSLRSDDYFVKEMVLSSLVFHCMGISALTFWQSQNQSFCPYWKLNLVLVPLLPYKCLMGSTAPVSYG